MILTRKCYTHSRVEPGRAGKSVSRTVIVSGGAKGIGAAIAGLFQQKGDLVIVLDKTVPAGLSAPGVMFLECDVTDEAGLEQASANISQLTPGIDVLVNNTGLFQAACFGELDAASWRQMLEVNLTSAFLCTRALRPLLRERAVIINLSSSLANIPEPQAIAYCVAKAGLEMFARCLALEFAPAGIRVLTIAPGPVASAEEHGEACRMTMDEQRILNPLRRFATAEEVAEAIDFLASPKAAYMTGTVVAVNGGESAAPVAWSVMQELRSSGASVPPPPVPCESAAAMAPSERVRRSADWVAARAMLVRIDEAGLERFVDRLSFSEIQESYTWQNGYHPRSASREALVNYVFTIDAINFGSGFSPLWKARRQGSTYTAVASMLAKLHAAGTRLDAAFAADITPAQLAAELKVEAEFPLVKMYTRALNELGRWVLATYGTYTELLENLPGSRRAQALVELLVQNVPSFNDHCLYGQALVYFYKRAQILVHDLHLALKETGTPFGEEDVRELTMFADNLVPHVLRKEGVLFYDPALLDRINKSNPLPAGSMEEVEIRAAGVVAVEKIAALLCSKGKPVTAAQIDLHLWTRGQASLYKAEPRHLTPTYFY